MKTQPELPRPIPNNTFRTTICMMIICADWLETDDSPATMIMNSNANPFITHINALGKPNSICLYKSFFNSVKSILKFRD